MHQAAPSIGRWIEQFPVHNDVWNSLPWYVSSPIDLATLEQVRSIIFEKQKPESPLPAHIHLFSKDGTTSGAVSRVGGVPHRPRHQKWPTTNDQQPYRFLAQFSFVDHPILQAVLPSDVLLVFTRDLHLAWPEPGQLWFEWQPATISSPLTRDGMPSSWSPQFVECLGHAVRVIDYTAPSTEAHVNQFLTGHSEGNAWSRKLAARALCRYLGMKVGGAPYWFDPAAISPARDLPGTFIASLATITPAPEVAFPWTNVPEPLSYSQFHLPENILDCRDGFVLNISLDTNNQIHWVCQFA